MSQLRRVLARQLFWLVTRNRKATPVRYMAKHIRSLHRLIENDCYDKTRNGELFVLNRLAQTLKVKEMWDVGANIGEYSLLAEQYFPEARIHAFEPVKPTFNKLLETIRKHPRILAHNYGLGSRTSVEHFSIQPADLANATIHPVISKLLSPTTERFQDTCLLKAGAEALSELGTQRIDFLKVDTEGHELAVLRGLKSLLEAGEIKAIQFEYNANAISSRTLLFDFYELLRPAGYKVGKIFPTFVSFHEYHPMHEDYIGPNYLAVHESEVDAAKSLS